ISFQCVQSTVVLWRDYRVLFFGKTVIRFSDRVDLRGTALRSGGILAIQRVGNVHDSSSADIRRARLVPGAGGGRGARNETGNGCAGWIGFIRRAIDR